MEFSNKPNWTDNYPTGYFHETQEKPLYKKVTEHDLAQQRLAYFTTKGNNTGFEVPLNSKGPPPPITKVDTTSVEGFSLETSDKVRITTLLLLFLLILLVKILYKKL
jgi:hypothetical protein